MIYLLSFLSVIFHLKEIYSFSYPTNINLRSTCVTVPSSSTSNSLPSSPCNRRNKSTQILQLSLKATSAEEETSSASTKKSTTITIPQHYPHTSSPTHENEYPSPLHKIHIQPLLTPNEASQCLNIAKSYAEQTQCWTKRDSDRHVTYATADFPIDECSDLETYLLDELKFEDRIWNWIHDEYDIDSNQLSFLDLFCAHYQGKEDHEDGIMDRLDQHRDGSLLSFTIVLSESDAYIGGGTIFDALRDINPSEHPEYNGHLLENGIVRVQSPGEAVLHSGKVKHGGNVVTQGERTVIVGFVDVSSTCMRDGVLQDACKEWGRSDVAKNRLNRQIQMTNSSSMDKWEIKNLKFMNGNHFGGYIPAFDSVIKRGDEEYQRERNLQIEDILLRDVLLERSERITSKLAAQFGNEEITIL